MINGRTRLRAGRGPGPVGAKQRKLAIETPDAAPAARIEVAEAAKAPAVFHAESGPYRSRICTYKVMLATS
jgi:hypothetical protein